MVYDMFSRLQSYHGLSAVRVTYVIFITRFYLNSKVFSYISTIKVFSRKIKRGMKNPSFWCFSNVDNVTIT